MNRTLESEDIKIMAMYSAKNTITKSTDLYSVLNPLTNSLSPSAKSKGDRLASARTLTLNIRKVIRLHDMADTCFSWPMSHKINITDPSTIIVILTS